MYQDAQLQFSSSQALTAATASTNLVDLGTIRDLGNGENLFVVTCVITAFTDTGSNSTVTVDFQTDDNSSFSSNATGQTLFTMAAVSAAGTVYIARLNPGAANERYGRIFYTMNNGDLSAGAVTTFITHDVQKYVSYADGLTIS